MQTQMCGFRKVTKHADNPSASPQTRKMHICYQPSSQKKASVHRVTSWSLREHVEGGGRSGLVPRAGAEEATNEPKLQGAVRGRATPTEDSSLRRKG